jgi:hypothetical protein
LEFGPSTEFTLSVAEGLGVDKLRVRIKDEREKNKE